MQRPDNPRLSWIIRTFLDVGDAIRRFRARRWGVEYEYFFLDSNSHDLEALSKYVEQGKLVPVVGSRVSFRNIEKVKELCWQVYRGKGGIGKAVIEIIEEEGGGGGGGISQP